MKRIYRIISFTLTIVNWILLAGFINNMVSINPCVYTLDVAMMNTLYWGLSLGISGLIVGIPLFFIMFALEEKSE